MKSKETILKEYQKKVYAITTQMLRVLWRAQRKVDDTAYRKAIEKIQKKI